MSKFIYTLRHYAMIYRRTPNVYVLYTTYLGGRDLKRSNNCIKTLFGGGGEGIVDA